MAAAVIPVVEALAPLAPALIQLITGLVHPAAQQAEQHYGPGTGPVKFADVFGKVIAALQSAAAAGQIDKTLPSDETVKMIIEAVISSMNLTGQLTGTTAVPEPSGRSGSQNVTATQTVILKPGQSLTVTGA